MVSKLSVFLAELKRRKVGRAAVLYAVVGFAAIEGAGLVQPTFGFSQGVIDFVVLLVLLGFPVALVTSWFVELTPSGLRITPNLTPEQLGSHHLLKWTPGTWALAAAGALVFGAAGYFAVLAERDEPEGPEGLPVQAAERDGLEGPEGLPEVVTVAVLPLENHTGDAALDPYRSGFAANLTEALVEARVPGMQVVDFLEVQFVGEETAGADLVVRGGIWPRGDSLQFRLRIVDPEGVVLETTVPVVGHMESLNEAAQSLELTLVAALAQLVSPGHELTFVGLGRHLPDPEAYELLMKAWRLAPELGSWKPLVPYLEKSLELDPDYFWTQWLSAYVYGTRTVGRHAEADSLWTVLERRSLELTAVERWSTQSWASWVRGDNESAVRAAEQLVSEFPEYTSTGWFLGMFSIAANRPRAAVDALEQYDPHRGEMARAWAGGAFRMRAEAHHMLGEFEDALEVIQEARAIEPGTLVGQEVRNLAALGRIEQLMALLEGAPDWTREIAWVELRAHGYPDASMAVAERALADLQHTVAQQGEPLWMLRAFERWDDAAKAAQRLHAENPTNPMPLQLLGNFAAKMGARDEALHYSRELGELAPPGRGSLMGFATYSRACIAANLGDLDDAVSFLWQALDEGYRFRIGVHADPDLQSLRGYPPFEEFMRPKG
jgi:tetratricopeptide (TPR) repeat protein